MPHSLVISIIVFARNAASTIEKTLQSVVANGQPPVELLVLDGGSTDGTVDIIRRYESKIAYWRSYPDGGATNAINEGVSRATGDIVCLLPADDWVEPGGLHWVCDEFAADPELAVLSSGVRFVHLSAEGSIHVDATYADPWILEFTMENIVRYPLTSGRFIRRDLYTQVGNFSSDYFISNDLDFLIRVQLRKPRNKVLPRIVFSYRRHSGSRTLGGDPDIFFGNMQDNVRVAAYHLRDARLTKTDRQALLGLHGRASARVALTQFRRREFRQASGTILRALVQNPLWPAQVLWWAARKSRPFG